MKQAQPTVAPERVAQMDVRFVSGEAYEVAVRGHRVLVDQPADSGGQDIAPTPTELFIVSVETCIAFYAGRYLTRHGFGPQASECRSATRWPLSLRPESAASP